jgi:hypothetical protein
VTIEVRLIINPRYYVWAYRKKGLYHREDGPALKYSDGTSFWYVEGKLVEVADGQQM